jgi:hypothetical protein
MPMYGRDRAGAAALLIGALALLLGCGSDGGAPGGGDGGVAPTGSGTLTWLDNGTKHSALFATGARVTTTMIDMVQVSGGEANTGISFGVSMPPPLVPGTYPCGVSGTGSRIIVSFSDNSGVLFQSCTVTLTSIGGKTGEHAVGTFSATGGGKAITGGMFDVPLTVSSR